MQDLFDTQTRIYVTKLPISTELPKVYGMAEHSTSTVTTIKTPITTSAASTSTSTTSTTTTTTTTARPTTTSTTTTFTSTTTTTPKSIVKTLDDIAEVKIGSASTATSDPNLEQETTTHKINTPTQVFKPYPAINKPKFSHNNKQAAADGLVIIQPAKVVEITNNAKKMSTSTTTEAPFDADGDDESSPKDQKPLVQPKSFDFKGDFFDRYYKEGWKDKDVKQSDKIPDFLKYAIPMPMSRSSQRRMDVSIQEMHNLRRVH